MFMHKQPSTKINKAQVKLKSIQSKIFMYFLKHTLKHILKIFQKYFKNTSKIFKKNIHAEQPSTKIKTQIN